MTDFAEIPDSLQDVHKIRPSLSSLQVPFFCPLPLKANSRVSCVTKPSLTWIPATSTTLAVPKHLYIVHMTACHLPQMHILS